MQHARAVDIPPQPLPTVAPVPLRWGPVPRRVVSLLPSTTEIVAALGYADCLVGRSHECDHPPAVVDLPVVSRPRREPIGTSAEIDRGVRELLRDVLSIYEVDPVALRAAGPDLVITQDLCRVCAVDRSAVDAAVREHLGTDVEVLTSSPVTLDDVLHDVRRVATALGDAAAGERVVDRLRVGFADLRALVPGRPRPRVLLVEWVDPLLAGGHWSPELVDIAGGEPVQVEAGAGAPVLTPEALQAADPDVIVVAPCGFDLLRAEQEAEVLAAVPGWEGLRAVRKDRVYYADGSAYFNRPGPRLVESAAIIAAAAHGVGPGRALEGSGWVQARR